MSYYVYVCVHIYIIIQEKDAGKDSSEKGVLRKNFKLTQVTPLPCPLSFPYIHLHLHLFCSGDFQILLEEQEK